MPENLAISRLTERHEGVTPAIGECFSEAARVCLNRHHLPNIKLKFLNLYPLELPPLPEQKGVVRRMQGLFALADQLEVGLAKARGQVYKLTPSLYHQKT